MIQGQSPCQGVASSPPSLLPEGDSFLWMVVRPYGVGKLKLASFLSRVSILTRDIDIANLSGRPSVCP